MSVGSGDDLHAGIEAGDGLKQFRGGVGPNGNEHRGKPGVQRGADGQAEEVILELQPDYEPWFEPILEPASGEVESLLFALQAAIGAGVVGFVLGRITKKPEKRDQG